MKKVCPLTTARVFEQICSNFQVQISLPICATYVSVFVISLTGHDLRSPMLTITVNGETIQTNMFGVKSELICMKHSYRLHIMKITLLEVSCHARSHEVTEVKYYFCIYLVQKSMFKVLFLSCKCHTA